uniref:Macroglobulin domain-containing protein n=1 Tax=Acanthochromis polyacanthus TaxID=80966 RepID=A0A3Q1FNK2_9TELE
MNTELRFLPHQSDSNSCICVNLSVCRQYMVTFPAVLEAGVQTKLCASLTYPNETLLMTVTLISEREKTTLFQRKSSIPFYQCSLFTPQAELKEEVQHVEVKVQGTFHSRVVKNVTIKTYDPMTFVQTDKPIYLPGQTGNSELMICDADGVHYIQTDFFFYKQ